MDERDERTAELRQNEKRLTLKPTEAAELMQVSMPTMYQMCRMDGFPVIHIGRKILIPKKALEEWLNTVAVEQGAVFMR